MSGICRTTLFFKHIAYFQLHDASKLFSEYVAALPVFVYIKRSFRTWMEAGLPLVCRKTYHCRGTPVPTHLPLHRNGRNKYTQNTSVNVSIAATLLIDCLRSLQKRNDHVWFCRYTRSYTQFKHCKDPETTGQIDMQSDHKAAIARSELPINNKTQEMRREPWSTVRMEQRAHVFSAVIGVFAGLTSASLRMHRKRSSRSRFEKDVELASEVGRVLERTRFKRSFRSIRGPRAFWTVPLRTWMCRYNFFRNGNWWRSVVSSSIKTLVLEARSVLYAVRHAESRYSPGRLLTFSDNLALVLALCKGRSKNHIAFKHTLYLCFWHQDKFCPIFQVDTI